MKAAARVYRPTVTSAPPIVSISPARPIIEINVILAKFGFATGKPNHFCRPELRNSKPAIIRRMLRTCGWNLPRLVSIVGVPPSIVARRPRATGRVAPIPLPGFHSRCGDVPDVVNPIAGNVTRFGVLRPSVERLAFIGPLLSPVVARDDRV